MMANVLLGIHCVMPGCTSTQRRVNQWKTKPCGKPKHKGKTHAQCMCPEPYQFFKFPQEVKLQKMWLDRVKRPDLEVNNLTRVCSLHFVEGRPTRRHYFPNINLHQEQEDDEADNEEEMEYLDESIEGTEEVSIQEAIHSQPPSKKTRGLEDGKVSIVPVQGPRRNEGQLVEDEELKISRCNYQGREGGAYEIPTNSVTITRVMGNASTPPVTSTTTSYAKPANRFINTNKPRMDGGTMGNRFLRDRPAQIGTTSVGLVTRKSVQSAPILQARPAQIMASSKSGNVSSAVRRSVTSANASTNIKQLQQNQIHPKTIKKEEVDYSRDATADEECDDDGDGDSSDLSDIGIDIQPTGSFKKQYTSKDISTAKTLSSMVVSRHHVPLPHTSVVPPQKDVIPSAKPKLIPILAVAPKSQQGTILQPVVATRTVPAQQNNRKTSSSNALASKPGSTSSLGTTAYSSVNSPVVTKTVIAVAGSSCVVKTESSTTPSVPVITSTSSLTTTPGQQQKSLPVTTAPAPPSLATYDPSKQQLQIANPVKYIQECHARIAQLLAEKQNVELKNAELEVKVQELQKSNNDLRREIVHQALNAARRAPQHQLTTPTFNLIPTAIMNATSSVQVQEEGESEENSLDSASPTNSSKSRIRYVIRRPANLSSSTTSTK